MDAMFRALAKLDDFQSVTVTAGGEATRGLLDDGEDVQIDPSTGQRAQLMGTVVRIREGAITRPAALSTVTVTLGDVDTVYQVNEVRKDLNNPGMLILVLAAA